LPIALHSKRRILDISQPIVMGILNATPDSFYNKGQSSDTLALLHAAEKIIKEGASIIDIGGASTRPGQPLIHADQELIRVMPAIKAIHEAFPDTWLSIDTYNAKVARAAVEAGADIVNDVSSGRFDKEMLQVVASLGTPYIIMHMQGTPETMQQSPAYSNVVEEVYKFLEDMCGQCAAAGIKEVIIDPGFGFGKTVEHNFSLLKSLDSFAGLGKIIMAGLSRKSMICKPLKVNPEHALNGTTALNMVALQQGANILRVHDVKEAMEVIKLWTLLKE
jgi:dihydropteroate synthase